MARVPDKLEEEMGLEAGLLTPVQALAHHPGLA